MPSPLRRWGPWALLALLVAGALVVAARDDDPQTDEERARALAARVACPQCDGQSVAASRSTVAEQLRGDIAARVAAGQSDAEILDAYARTYGEDVLLRPKADGVGVLVYAVPIAAVLAGAVGLGLVVRRWQREPAQVASADDLVLVARARTDPSGSSRGAPRDPAPQVPPPAVREEPGA